ncbi:MAG: hypothetical protein KJO07_25215, partial [Deltaproteobacteria bacterium]|nr:hypothetical protein [Deltaproteobacteria bacterium]
ALRAGGAESPSTSETARPEPVAALPTQSDADEPALATRTRPRKRRGLVVAGAAAIFCGGMAIAIIEAVSPSAPREASAAAERAPAPAAATVETPAEVVVEKPSLAQLRARAYEVLAAHLQSPSRRVRRIAALALARVDDQRATDVLQALLGSETSELRKIEIALALAESGDDQARQVLRDGLRSKRRDARLDAATALARLGDDTGRRYLRAMLSIRTHKLGAAAVLAELDDERGLDVLRKALGKRSSPAARMRAAVALGRAGQADAHEVLGEILADGRYQVGAAEALARLGDRRSVPTLVRQLGHSSVRVEAALALRELGVEVELEPLAAALRSGDEVAAVSAAEAVLILVPDQEGGD